MHCPNSLPQLHGNHCRATFTSPRAQPRSQVKKHGLYALKIYFGISNKFQPLKLTIQKTFCEQCKVLMHMWIKYAFRFRISLVSLFWWRHLCHFHLDIGEPWYSMAKIMSHYGITIGQLRIGILEQFSEETECHNREPLYFLPSSDQKSQHFLYEVNNKGLSRLQLLKTNRQLLYLSLNSRKYFACFN